MGLPTPTDSELRAYAKGWAYRGPDPSENWIVQALANHNIVAKKKKVPASLFAKLRSEGHIWYVNKMKKDDFEFGWRSDVTADAAIIEEAKRFATPEQRRLAERIIVEEERKRVGEEERKEMVKRKGISVLRMSIPEEDMHGYTMCIECTAPFGKGKEENTYSVNAFVLNGERPELLYNDSGPYSDDHDANGLPNGLICEKCRKMEYSYLPFRDEDLISNEARRSEFHLLLRDAMRGEAERWAAWMLED